MAENYREQQQEETEGIVDAGGFQNDPGTGMIAEDQETAAAADAVPVEAQPNEHQDAEAPEAFEQPQVDLHENTGSGIDIAVVIIVLLVVIGCLSFGIWNAMQEPAPVPVAQQQAASQATSAESDEYEPSFEVVELSEGVAAVVNGEVIEEVTIDEYVVGFREAYGLEDDGNWAQWLLGSGYTPEKVRDLAIATYVDEALVKQAIAESGVEASQADIDEIYNSMRENFATEEEWQQALEEADMTDESFREQCAEQARQRAFLKYLGDNWYTPEELEAETLVAVKSYYPEYADAESLEGIDEELLEPVREMVQYYAQQDAYTDFLTKAREDGDIKMSATPSELPYDANLITGLFQGIAGMLAQSQAQQQ